MAFASITVDFSPAHWYLRHMTHLRANRSRLYAVLLVLAATALATPPEARAVQACQDSPEKCVRSDQICNVAGRPQLLVRFRTAPDTALLDALDSSADLTPQSLDRFRLHGPLGESGYYRLPVAPDAFNRAARILTERGDDARPEYAYRANQPKIPSDQDFPMQWNLHNTGQMRCEKKAGCTSKAEPEAIHCPADIDLNAPEAWQILWPLEREQLRVAILDTGLGAPFGDGDHWSREFEGVVLPTPIDGTRNNPPDPADGDSHGTRMASIVGAKGDNGKWIAGVMWGAKLVICKISEKENGACEADTVNCLRHVENTPHVVAVNYSWTGPRSCWVEDAIDRLRLKGVLLVAAAGTGAISNDDLGGCPDYPATSPLPNIISVTAANQHGVLEEERYGRRTVHVAAPGICIPSLEPDQGQTASGGTSSAAAQVSGLLALLRARYAEKDERGVYKMTASGLRNLALAGGVKVPELKQKTITGRRVRAADAGGLGSLTCVGQKVRRRLLPLEDPPLPVPSKVPILIRALSIDCADPTPPGNLEIRDENGDLHASPTFRDDGVPPDIGTADGEYVAEWTPQPGHKYRLRFWNVWGESQGFERAIPPFTDPLDDEDVLIVEVQS